MLVRFPQSLVIAEYFNYDQFGEIVLALPLAGRVAAVHADGDRGARRAGERAHAREPARAGSRSTTRSAPRTRRPAPSERQPVLADEPLPRRRPRRRTPSACSASTSACYRIQPTGAGRLHGGQPAAGGAGARRRHAPRRRDEHAQLLHHRATTRPATRSTTSAAPRRTSSAAARTPTSRTSSPGSATSSLAALAGLNADVLGLNEIENTPGVDPLTDPQGHRPRPQRDARRRARTRRSTPA